MYLKKSYRKSTGRTYLVIAQKYSPTFTAKITKEGRKPLVPKGQRLFPFVINM